MNNKLVYGVGFSSSGKFYRTVNKKKSEAYAAWHNMLRRCYDPKFIGTTSYTQSLVDERWFCFQTFAEWYFDNKPNTQEKIVLDKDIKIIGNRLYSPETCLLVPRRVNELFIGCTNFENDISLGSAFVPSKGKYIGRCRSLKGKDLYLGLFETQREAYSAWRETKSLQFRELSEIYDGELKHHLLKMAERLACDA